MRFIILVIAAVAVVVIAVTVGTRLSTQKSDPNAGQPSPHAPDQSQ